MTYNEALEYIGKVCWQGSRPGLERITELCSRLGNIQNELKFVHIAGTNGKGSTTSMLASVLAQEGKKVGIFTSPFIYKFNERIAINGTAISDADLTKTLEAIIPHAESMEDKPTEFELITAVGFLYFYNQKCDIVLLECGMGGRLDSTNIIKNPLLSIITTIALDHTAFLGNTTAAIAKEKAGIIKENGRVLVGEADEQARAAICEKAQEMNAELSFADLNSAEKVNCSINETTFFSQKIQSRISLPLLGTYQINNAQLAIEAAVVLGAARENIVRGLSQVKWKGRFEVISKNPLVIYDGSHNPQGIAQCVNSIEQILAAKVAVFTAVMADKDYQKESDDIARIADRVFCVTAANKRALGADELARVFANKGVPSKAYPDFRSALHEALSYCKDKNLPLVAMGSLYIYREFVDMINKEL